MLVLCVKMAFCVNYNSISRLYCALLAWCTRVGRLVAKQQKKTGGKHHEAWCSSPVSV